MRQPTLKPRSCNRFLALLVALPLFAIHGASAQNFRFLHIADTRVASSRSDALRDLVRTADRMQPRPAFILSSGSATETGRAEEFETYLRVAADFSIPHHVAPGTRDVRWSGAGKEGFLRSFGGTAYRSFDHDGVHFVQLDSTMLLHPFGHFGREQLLWLDRDLKRLKRGTPVIVYSHHGPGPKTSVVDDAEDLLRVLGPHNVVAVFVGQGEQDLEWRANGLPFLATRGLNQGSYHIVDVKNGSVQIRSVSREDREPKLVATAKLEARPFRRIATLWDDAGISLLERRRILAELRIDEKGAHDDRVTAAYSIDGGPEQPMKRDARDTESVSFMAEFETIGMKHGAHTLQLSFRAPDGELFTREESFVVERLDGVKRRWERPFQAADAILSGVVLGEGLVFGGSLDGSVFAIDPARGRRKWLSDLPGPVHGSPTYSNGMLYLASLDHFVYAFEAKSGKLRWKFDTGGALFFPPEVLGDVVCVPGNRAVFGLDAKTGKALWKQNAGGAHQAQPAASDSAFVVCGSEDTLTCYEAASGAIRWSAGAPRAEGGRSQPSDDLAPTVASPAAGEGRVYFRSKDGVLHAVDGRTGRDVWTARAPDGADKFGGISPLFHGGRIYLGCLGPKNRGDLVCLDADTGNLVWRCSTGAGSYDSSPAMQGPNVVIAALDGTLSWVDAATGKLRFQHRLDPGHCFAIPAADELAVYMSSMNGTVTALELPK